MKDALDEILVTELKEGDYVDLESCPYLKDHPTAKDKFAIVDSTERETEECIRVAYQDEGTVGYPVTQKLWVRQA